MNRPKDKIGNTKDRSGAQKKMFGAVGALFGLLVVQRLSCGSGVDNGGIKPPKYQTPEQRKQDVETRIKMIEDNPNMPQQGKDMIISMIKAQAQSSSAAQRR